MRALGPRAAFGASLALLRERPLATLALGLAIITSLAAVCCGLGLVAAPWFLCELFALQIALGTGATTRRSRAWLWAGTVQMMALSLWTLIGGLTLLAVGPDVVLAGAHGPHPPLQTVLESLGLLVGVGGLTLALTVHFEHTPAILLDRGGSLASAMLESVCIVSDTGAVRTWLTSGVAHGLQMAPAVIGLALATARGTLASSVAWGIALLPLFALCLVLGQGMLVASYLALRESVRLPRDPAAFGPRAPSLLWMSLLTMVLLGLIAVTAALLRPTAPRAQGLPADAEVVLDVRASQDTEPRFVPDTALRIDVDRRALRVTASDGGGAGLVPLPAGDIVRVRAGRTRTRLAHVDAPSFGTSTFALEATLADGSRYTTFIDDTGVRLDDSFTRRFSALLPLWALFSLAACLVWTAAWIARALPAQARLRRELGAMPRDDELRSALEHRLVRVALRNAALLSPASFASLAIGLWAMLG